jgi:hypothetical protein
MSNVDTGRRGIAEAEPECKACRSSTIDRKLILTKGRTIKDQLT